MQLIGTTLGAAIPEEALVSLKAMEQTGLWNNIWKIGHAAWLFRYFVPFLFYCRASVAGPKIHNWLKALKKNEAKDLPIGTAGFVYLSNDIYCSKLVLIDSLVSAGVASGSQGSVVVNSRTMMARH